MTPIGLDQLDQYGSNRTGLVHKSGGAEHARWIFDYDPEELEDDEAGYRFGTHDFAPGEYVSIRGADGVMHTFAVASVSSVL
jgi:hypothetical protein